MEGRKAPLSLSSRKNYSFNSRADFLSLSLWNSRSSISKDNLYISMAIFTSSGLGRHCISFLPALTCSQPSGNYMATANQQKTKCMKSGLCWSTAVILVIKPLEISLRLWLVRETWCGPHIQNVRRYVAQYQSWRTAKSFIREKGVCPIAVTISTATRFHIHVMRHVTVTLHAKEMAPGVLKHQHVKRVAVFLLSLTTDIIQKFHGCFKLWRWNMNVTKDTLWLESAHSPAVLHAGQVQPLSAKLCVRNQR